jgi:pimeloyl-ACP methyl ester carboxylesterase
VVILHGWSDNSASFKPLAKVLQANGYKTVPIWLGDYVSKDDDVGVADVAKRMEEVLQGLVAAGTLAVPFDMIVHSTGGLVARTWLTMFDGERAARWLERLVMLAPANYGSRLASLGKSMLGRLTKGLDNGLQTGKLMLDSLELGSPFQWQLSLADVLQDGPPSGPVPVPYSDVGCLPFVITGIKGYDSLLRRALNEDGADGTVRAAAANLTAYGLTLDFRFPQPQPTLWTRRGPLDAFAFRLVGDVDHASIVEGGPSVLPRILEALACPMDSAAYLAIRKNWSEANDALEAQDDPTRHRFFQLNTFVIDDLGQPVADHFIEFSGTDEASKDASLGVFQSDVIEDVHVNETNGACRTFYIDRTDLFSKFYASREAGRPRELVISVWATPPGPNVTYFSPAAAGGGSGQYRIHLQDETLADDRWLRRYSTHFLKIIIPRRPMPDVFRLTRA